MAKRGEKTVLFLCTGNYYRSRFAEVLFNSVAGRMGLPWRASSRGLALERGVNNVGPRAVSAIKALEARGMRVADAVTRLLGGGQRPESQPTEPPGPERPARTDAQENRQTGQNLSADKAEREGFEPSVGLLPHRFSRPARSATPAPLRVIPFSFIYRILRRSWLPFSFFLALLCTTK